MSENNRPRNTTINPETGRIIRIGGATFNQLIFDAYDFINGELVRRATAPPARIPERYFNVETGRIVRYGTRRYFEYINAGWEIEDDYYLIPPDWNVEYRAPARQPAVSTVDQLLDRHRDRLAELNISLCKECLYPIKAGEGEYCKDCTPAFD